MPPLKGKEWLDLPPIWLAGALIIARIQALYLPAGLNFGPALGDFLGGLFTGAGILLMCLAIYEMRRQKTTIVPHQSPEHLVQTGIFSRTRNPIYLGDLLVLAGLILYWDAVLSLPLIPLFLWVIERRFVRPEEDIMRRKFRAEFARYCQKTRRWV